MLVNRAAYANIMEWCRRNREPFPNWIKPAPFRFKPKRVKHIRNSRVPKRQPKTLTVTLKKLTE